MATKLRVVTSEPTAPKPARKLGEHGTLLWKSIMAEYEIADAGGLEMLTLACQQLDSAESLRAQIEEDGVMVKGKNALREHPCLRHELHARAFVARTLQRLGLDVEAIKPQGRPPGSFRRG